MSTVQKYEDYNDIESKKELIKSVYFKGCSDQEVELFLHVCKKTGLDPIMRQIYPVKRWSSAERKEVMTCQTSIDGFRLIAERTGRYSPGREPFYVYTDKEELVSATAYVKKMTADGTWHEVAATAFLDEYAQRKKEGGFSQFWERMPKAMLAKCAESLALRKAFPADLSGIYTTDEMDQAGEPAVPAAKKPVEFINEAQIAEIESLLLQREELRNKLFAWANIQAVAELPTSKLAPAMKAIELHIKAEERE